MYNAEAIIGRCPYNSGNASLSLLLNNTSASLQYAITFQVGAAIQCDKVAFCVAAKTGSPTCTIGIQSDNGSGRPSGTFLASGNAKATAVAITATGWTSEIALTSGVALAVGTIYHLVIFNDAGTPASNNFSVQDQNLCDNPVSGSSYTPWMGSNHFSSSFNGTTWSDRTGPIYMLAKADGTQRHGQPVDTISLQTLSSTTGYGLKFTARLTGSVFGLILSHLPDNASGTITAKMYDSGGTLLGTATLVAGIVTDLGLARYTNFLSFDAGAVSIAAGSTYYCLIYDSGSADRLEYVKTSNATYAQIPPAMQDMCWASLTGTTFTPTLGQLPVLMELLVSSITSSGGSGGGAPIIGSSIVRGLGRVA